MPPAPDPELLQVPGHLGRLHLEEGDAPTAVVRTIDSGARPVVKLLRSVEGQGGHVETRQREVIRQQNVRTGGSLPRRSGCDSPHRGRGSAGADKPCLGVTTTALGVGRSQP